MDLKCTDSLAPIFILLHISDDNEFVYLKPGITLHSASKNQSFQMARIERITNGAATKKTVRDKVHKTYLLVKR